MNAERWDGRTATWIPIPPSDTNTSPRESSARPAPEQRSAPAQRPAGAMKYVRMYHAAQGQRLAGGWGASTSSADSELNMSLPKLRNGARALVRDAAYAGRAQTVIMNNVIGGGIGLQAQVKRPRGKLEESINTAIEEAWADWSRAKNCHTGGMLSFPDLERMLMGQIFAAGEIFVRKHYARFGTSRVPLALEVIEPERVADSYTVPQPASGNEIRMGVEVDRFQRPVAYWVRERHPGDQRTTPHATDRLERIPADQMFHLYIVNRWPQTRGEPWLHAVGPRLHDMDGYSEAEIIAARGASSYMAFIKTPDNTPIPEDDQEAAGEREILLRPGIIEQLPPGWDITMNNPNRPNPNMDPFMRMMLREVASGVGVSYESLSRDYSQTTYSSGRLGILDDRDLWRVLQGWFIRAFRAELHRDWLNQAVLARAIAGIPVADYAADPARFEAARYKPRGWSWIDPSKEVEAYRLAVRCGFMTVSDVIAQTANGADIEDVLDIFERERELMQDKGLKFETDIANDQNQQAKPAAKPAAADDEAAPEKEPGDESADDSEKERARVVSLRGQSHG